MLNIHQHNDPKEQVNLKGSTATIANYLAFQSLRYNIIGRVIKHIHCTAYLTGYNSSQVIHQSSITDITSNTLTTHITQTPKRIHSTQNIRTPDTSKTIQSPSSSSPIYLNRSLHIALHPSASTAAPPRETQLLNPPPTKTSSGVPT